VYARFLGYLSKVQGLNENRDTFRAPRRDHAGGDTNRRPQFGAGRDDKPREWGNVNVHFVRRQTDRRNSNYNNQCNGIADDRDFYGRRQGRAEDDSSVRLNPNAQQFSPHVARTDKAGRDSQNQHDGAQNLNN
jgi:hypothetical protein